MSNNTFPAATFWPSYVRTAATTWADLWLQAQDIMPDGCDVQAQSYYDSDKRFSYRVSRVCTKYSIESNFHFQGSAWEIDITIIEQKPEGTSRVVYSNLQVINSWFLDDLQTLIDGRM